MTRTIVLDSGALIAVERNNTKVVSLLKASRERNATVLIPAGAIAEAWRGGRQANLARLLNAAHDIPALDAEAAKRIGVAIASCSGRGTAIDASVVDVALRNIPALILTSDPEDIGNLLGGEAENSVRVEVV